MTRRGRAQDQQRDFVLDDSTAVSPRATPPRLWGARSRAWVADQRRSLVGHDPGVSLRLLYLIFCQVLGLVVAAAGPDIACSRAVLGRIRRRPILGGLLNEYEAA